MFITGVTFSSDLPMVSAEQPTIGGSNQSDAYLAKFSPDVPDAFFTAISDPAPADAPPTP
ncbi:MAG TPA: hypothetical protein VGP90_02085 [Acidimicrobiia bacterium]|nr:hypothetical protein [Acidimicrobiia bacterium]